MTSSHLLDKAKSAIANSDENQSEKMYEEIVKAIEVEVGKNQKDIATELQKISRALEAEGQTDHAFMFKQRTCATMLRLSMEERRMNRTMASRTAQNLPAASMPSATTPSATVPSTTMPSPAPNMPTPNMPAPAQPSSSQLTTAPHSTASSSASSPRPYLSGSSQTASSSGSSSSTSRISSSSSASTSASGSTSTSLAHIGKLEFICMPTDDAERSMKVYQQSIESPSTNGQPHGISIGGTNVLFVERASPSGPVFRVHGAEAVADRLAESGFTRLPSKTSTPHGMVIFLIDFSGNTFGLIEGQ